MPDAIPGGTPILLDTSALVFWTLRPDRLTTKAALAIAQADRLLVSAISIWEIAIKVKRGKLELPLDIDAYLDRLRRVDKLEILSVDAATWLANVALPWEHRDPADRTIVALAEILDCPLVSSDATIAAFYKATIW